MVRVHIGPLRPLAYSLSWHSISNILKSIHRRNFFRAIAWITIAVACLVLIAWMTVNLVLRYMLLETIFQAQLSDSAFPFPGITICRKNPFTMADLFNNPDAVALLSAAFKQQRKSLRQRSAGGLPPDQAFRASAKHATRGKLKPKNRGKKGGKSKKGRKKRHSSVYFTVSDLSPHTQNCYITWTYNMGSRDHDFDTAHAICTSVHPQATLLQFPNDSSIIVDEMQWLDDHGYLPPGDDCWMGYKGVIEELPLPPTTTGPTTTTASTATTTASNTTTSATTTTSIPALSGLSTLAAGSSSVPSSFSAVAYYSYPQNERLNISTLKALGVWDSGDPQTNLALRVITLWFTGSILKEHAEAGSTRQLDDIICQLPQEHCLTLTTAQPPTDQTTTSPSFIAEPTLAVASAAPPVTPAVVPTTLSPLTSSPDSGSGMDCTVGPCVSNSLVDEVEAALLDFANGDTPSDASLMMTVELLMKYMFPNGTELLDFQMWCHFLGNTNCSYLMKENNVDSANGKCYTFNHYSLRESTGYAYAPGLRNALTIYAIIDQSEQAPLTESAGLLAFFHDPDAAFVSDAKAFQTAPAFEWAFYISAFQANLLGSPYSKCGQGNAADFFYGGAYSLDGCDRSMQQKCTIEACNCSNPSYPAPANTSFCGFREAHCAEMAAAGCAQSEQTCVPPCVSNEYDVQLTRSEWPSKRWEGSKCTMFDVGTQAFDECQTRFKKGHAKLVFIIPSTQRIIYNESPAYTFVQLLSDIGSVSGMLFGMSVISLLEVGIIPCFAASYVTGKNLRQDRNKEQRWQQKQDEAAKTRSSRDAEIWLGAPVTALKGRGVARRRKEETKLQELRAQ